MPDLNKVLIWIIVLAILFVMVLCIIVNKPQSRPRTTASWYSVESCKKEGTSGIMANGEVLDDRKYTCASWFYPFSTKVKVSSRLNGKSVICKVTDRGPAKHLVKKGRIIDLSKAAFAKIARLEQGVIPVEISVISTTK